jgi:hypothetical protein
LIARLVLAALLLPALASSHTLEPARRAQVSVSFEPGAPSKIRVDVLFWLEVPKGEHAERLMARFDLDRDGSLNAAEGALVGRELRSAAYGSFGLRFSHGEVHGKDGVPVRSVDAQAQARREGDKIVSALLVTWRFDPAPNVRILFADDRAPLPLEVFVRPPLAGRDSAGRLTPGGEPLVVEVVPPAQ